MAGKTRTILRRVNSVKSTRKITRAMEMVSSAKLKGAQRKALELKSYAAKVMELLEVALQHRSAAFHPLLKERGTERTAIVLITSDKGLCGGYNANAIKSAFQLWRGDANESGGFITIGSKGRDVLRRLTLPCYRELAIDSGKPSYGDAQRVTDAVVHLFQQRTVDRVVLVYTEFVSAMTQVPRIQHLLPFSAVVPDEDDARDMFWEPGPAAVLDRLIPEYLGTMVYRALLESTASEFAARRAAMKAATDNATELIDKLTLQFNQARQAAITQELAEIVGGAEALK